MHGSGRLHAVNKSSDWLGNARLSRWCESRAAGQAAGGTVAQTGMVGRGFYPHPGHWGTRQERMMGNFTFLKTLSCSLGFTFRCLHRVSVLFLSPFPKSLNYRFSDGTWGVGGLRKNNSRTLKRQSDGDERSYASGEVATTWALCSPAMAGEVRNTKSACSSLWKTNIECNPTATPGQCPVTKLFPTSPSGVRVLRCCGSNTFWGL